MSDSIDAELLDYYQRELTWLRHAGAGFAGADDEYTFDFGECVAVFARGERAAIRFEMAQDGVLRVRRIQIVPPLAHADVISR